MLSTPQYWLSGDNSVFQRWLWLRNEFLPKTTWCGWANTAVFYIKCLARRKRKEKVALSSQNGPYEVQKFINMIDFFLESVFKGHYFKYSSLHHSVLIRWSHQSFSWSTWSAQNAGWCAPLSCRAWAGALSDWSSSTPSTTDSDTEMTPEIGWKKGGRREGGEETTEEKTINQW